MALILRKLWDGYNTVFFKWSDPRSAEWRLMGSPFKVLAILAFYLYFVKNLGPRMMQYRQPFKLKTIMIVYNICQILACSYIFYHSIRLGWGTTYKLFCEPVDFSMSENGVDVAKFVYYYFLLKVTDLLDTIFFVLLKKQSHISFLHVYHHTGMVCLIWAAVKYTPGGHGTFLGLLNTAVHVVMYSYYLLTLISPKYKKSIWWKKHITQLQIVQFLLLVIHFSSLIFVKDCEFPPWTAAVLVPQNLFMLFLFVDFYRKAYLKKPKKESIQDVIEQNGIETKQQNGYGAKKISDNDCIHDNSAKSQ